MIYDIIIGVIFILIYFILLIQIKKLEVGPEKQGVLLITTMEQILGVKDFFFLFTSTEMRDLVFSHLNRLVRRNESGIKE